MIKLIREKLGVRACKKACENGSRPVVVLAYHDLAGVNDISSWLKIEVASFERQLELLGEVGKFIRPADLLDQSRLADDRLNLLVTFDDGYENNYCLAYPVLTRLGIPALFFVSTWNMDTGEPFWFNRLIQLIQQGRISSLDLRNIGLRRYHFPSIGQSRRWSAIQQLLDDVKEQGNGDESSLADRIVNIILDSTNSMLTSAAVGRPLNSTQIKEMHESGLCHFGSHSHRHLILTGLSDKTLASDLQTSKEILGRLVEEEIVTICYPNGNSDRRVREAASAAGYRLGFTTRQGKVDREADLMQIPRVMVGGYDSPDRLLAQIGRVASCV